MKEEDTNEAEAVLEEEEEEEEEEEDTSQVRSILRVSKAIMNYFFTAVFLVQFDSFKQFMAGLRHYSGQPVLVPVPASSATGGSKFSS